MWRSYRTPALDTLLCFWFVLDADSELGACNMPNLAEMPDLSIPTYGWFHEGFQLKHAV